MQRVYVLVAILALAAVAGVLYSTGRAGPRRRLSPLAAVAFGFVVASMVFGDSRRVGYGLIGVGVALAVVDAVLQRRR